MSIESTAVSVVPRGHRRRIQAALVELQTALQKLYGPEEAPAVLVYGSQARGRANAASDVDVLLLFAKTTLRGQEISRISPILADLNLRYRLLISVLPSSRVDYENAAGPFWQNVRQEGVSIDAL